MSLHPPERAESIFPRLQQGAHAALVRGNVFSIKLCADRTGQGASMAHGGVRACTTSQAGALTWLWWEQRACSRLVTPGQARRLRAGRGGGAWAAAPAARAVLRSAAVPCQRGAPHHHSRLSPARPAMRHSRLQRAARCSCPPHQSSLQTRAKANGRHADAAPCALGVRSCGWLSLRHVPVSRSRFR